MEEEKVMVEEPVVEDKVEEKVEEDFVEAVGDAPEVIEEKEEEVE